jgi:hypothetical protein
VARFGCGRWNCVVCRRRKVDEWAVHLARCASGPYGLAGGWRLWLIDAPAFRDKAVKATLAKLVRKKQADYARVKGAAGGFHYLVASAEQPHPTARPAGDTLDNANLEGRLALVGWLRALPEPGSGGTFSRTRTRVHPVSTSARWKLPPREQGDWQKKFSLECRQLKPVLDVFRRFGVKPDGVIESQCPFAFRVDWQRPKGWSDETLERFEEALQLARDPVGPPNPAGAEADGGPQREGGYGPDIRTPFDD